MVELRRIAAVLIVGALVVACRNKEAPTSAPDTAAPEAGAPPATGAVAGDPLGEPERALADNAARLRALGVTLEQDDGLREPDAERPRATEESRKSVTKNTEPAATRCDELCGLADAACGLRVQICGLAEHHVGESRYEAACWRATDQCTRASTACDDCKGTSAGAAGSCAAG